MSRRFADLINEVFVQGTDTRTDGHPEVEVALVELYRQTGESRYLNLADTLMSRRGFRMFEGGRFNLDYYQDAEPVRDARSIVGHAVRALYLAAGVTDIYAETGDEALFAPMLRQWTTDRDEDSTYRRRRPRHHDEARSATFTSSLPTAPTATCASIASIGTGACLVTGDSRHADLPSERHNASLRACA